MKKINLLILIFLVWLPPLVAQTQKTRWKRTSQTQPELQLFHSLHVVNIPTAETPQRGDLEFEISHRFIPPITEGSEALYGIDGPVNMRLALGYAVTDNFFMTLGRSNLNDNLDVQLKYKAVRIRNKTLPVLIALQAGAAYNSQVFLPIESNSRKYQYYGRLIMNTMLAKKIGIGLAPSYLYNSNIYCQNVKDTFTLGNYIQFYVSPLWSLLLEWDPTITGWRQWHNSMTFGIELETGGHFFKIFFTNNDKLNPSQYLSGADLDFASRDWRLGFMITRFLKFTK